MQISQVMTPYTQPDFFKYDEKRYLSQFVSEMFDSLQYNSTKCAPQCEVDSFVTRATYWVPDLPHNKSFSCHLAFRFDVCWQHFICMIQQAYKYARSRLWPCLTFFKLKITNILKSSKWGLETSVLARKGNFFIAIGEFPVELLACQVSMFCIANWPR